MRTIVIAFGLVCLMGAILAQRVGIGTSTPDSSARLEVWDTLRGILIPRLTTAQRNAIPTPARSLLIYNIDCDEYQYYIPGTGWVSILTNVTTGGGGGSGTLTAYPATGIWAGGFTANWSPVAGATSYEVRVYQACSSSTVVATATFPAGSTSGPVSVSMTCNQAPCYEVRATVSSTGCGSTASLLISNRVPVTRSGNNPCTTPNTWVRLPDPPATMPERENYVTIAHNGFIYVGFGDGLSDWWRWDPCSGTWTPLASPPVTFGGLPFIFAIGPYIYVGGGGFGGGPLDDFYQYDPATDTWIQKANLPVPLHGAVGASDGTYGYVACGMTTGGTYIDTLYRYNPSTDSWTTLSRVPGNVGRWIPSMAYYQGKLYIGGGYSPSDCRQDFYAYDIAMNNWTTLPSHPTTHYDAWAVAYNGKIYVTGQHPGCNTCTNEYYSYNIASNSWSPMPSFTGGNRNNLLLVELNGVLYGGWGHACTTRIRDWWAFCP
jgi:N-acetylneuraminic acid mutarotase